MPQPCISSTKFVQTSVDLETHRNLHYIASKKQVPLTVLLADIIVEWTKTNFIKEVQYGSEETVQSD